MNSADDSPPREPPDPRSGCELYVSAVRSACIVASNRSVSSISSAIHADIDSPARAAAVRICSFSSFDGSHTDTSQSTRRSARRAVAAALLTFGRFRYAVSRDT